MRDYITIYIKWYKQTQIKQLHESVRKKSEREKQFDDERKKLSVREKKIEEREKALSVELKNKKKSSKRGKNIKSTVSKVKEQIESKDPLNRYRNMLPFHWICIFLVVILMLAIAQRKWIKTHKKKHIITFCV